MSELAVEQNVTNGLAITAGEDDIQPGNPLPIGGAHQQGDGVNFVLFSLHATSVRLELYKDADDATSARIIDLDSARHRTGDLWHVRVQGIPAGQLYGCRIDGPYQPEEGQRFNPHKSLLDPFQREIAANQKFP